MTLYLEGPHRSLTRTGTHQHRSQSQCDAHLQPKHREACTICGTQALNLGGQHLSWTYHHAEHLCKVLLSMLSSYMATSTEVIFLQYSSILDLNIIYITSDESLTWICYC
jgi:hypothetical protein